MKYFSIHKNNGELNDAMGQILCDYHTLTGDVFTFYNEQGVEVFWYKLAEGEGLSFYDDKDEE
jgi:hypothetical protein